MHRLDKYKHIKYRATSHKFWRRFPYKVIVAYKDGGIPQPPSRYVATWWHEYIVERSQAKKQRRAYIKSFAKYLPDADLFTRVDTAKTVNFFFVNEADTEHFVDSIKEKVSEVWRPSSAAHVAAMADHKVKVRKSLFHGRYRWCVVYQKLYDDKSSEFLEWEALYFRNEEDERDQERSYLFMGAQYRLYLRDETDVVFTKLGTSDIIDRIEKVVLESELETPIHETQFDPKTG